MTTVWTGDEMAGERGRRQNNRERVLDLLRQRGSHGATNVELVAVGGMRAVGGRVDELRAEGFDIETIRVHRGLFRFVLHEPSRSKGPQPGEVGYLASLEPIASIYDTNRPKTPAGDTPADGRLF